MYGWMDGWMDGWQCYLGFIPSPATLILLYCCTTFRVYLLWDMVYMCTVHNNKVRNFKAQF